MNDTNNLSVAQGLQRQVEPVAAGVVDTSAPRRCRWCGDDIDHLRADAETCSRKCRQAVWRSAKFGTVVGIRERQMRFAYADPPYPGLAKKRYGKEPTFAGEVDHEQLVATLRDGYDGWALSTSARALGKILPLCPPSARVCAWVKKIGPGTKHPGIINKWEPVIVVPGRKLIPNMVDYLVCQPARGNGTLMGRKPIKFIHWLFRLLGMLPGDQLDDLFPGTGIVGKTWSEICRAAKQDPLVGVE